MCLLYVGSNEKLIVGLVFLKKVPLLGALVRFLKKVDLERFFSIGGFNCPKLQKNLGVTLYKRVLMQKQSLV